MSVPIISESVFLEMDKNKDGYVSKRELRLAQRNLSLDDINELLGEADTDGDGRLTFEEVRQMAEKVRARRK